MSKVTRRSLLISSGAFAAAGALAACGGAAPAAPAAPAADTTAPAAPAASTTIQWWTGWGSFTLEAVVNSFHEANPEITVQWLGSVDQEKLLTAVAGGTPPDAATLGAYPELFGREVAMPITEWINSSASFNADDIFEASWNGAKVAGEVYGIPAVEGFVRYGLCVNADIASEAGLDPENLPRTWDEVFAWHEQLTTFDQAGNATLIGLDPMDAMGGSIGFGDPFMWPMSMGFDYYDQDARTYNVDNELTIEAISIIKRFYDVVGAEKMASFRQSYGTWTGAGSSFTSGVQAMQINGYWTPGAMVTNAPDTNFAYGWLPVPTARKDVKVQSMGGHYLFIPVGSPNPEAAFKFGEYLLGDEACDAIYNDLGWLPARKSYLQTVDTSKYPGLDWFVASATDADELWEVEIDLITGITSVQWTDNVDAVIYGDKTPEQAAADMQTVLTDELAQAFEAR